MQLSNDQQQAMDKVVSWWHDSRKTTEPFVLTGGAGTGKSTIVKEIMKELAIPVEDVLMLAPTGTAVKNIQQKNPGYQAQTISGFIEKPFTAMDIVDNASGDTVLSLMGRLDMRKVDIGLAMERPFNPSDPNYVATVNRLISSKGQHVELRVGFKFNDDIHAMFKFLLIDEWGMVSQTKAVQLQSLGIPILALGDPYQLKPVASAQNDLINQPKRTFYHELTTTHRQAGGNPILDVATSARNGQDWRATAQQVAGSNVAYRPTLRENRRKMIDLILRADVVLATSNSAVRHYNYVGHNARFSAKTTFGIDEPILFTANTRAKDTLGAPVFTNGTLGRVVAVHEQSNNEKSAGVQRIDVVVNDERYSVLANTLNLTDSRVSNSNLIKSQGSHIQHVMRDRGNLQDTLDYSQCSIDEIVYLAYGYAMTVHKSQGKEWDNVVFDTAIPQRMHATEQPLVYTAITRAKQNLIFV